MSRVEERKSQGNLMTPTEIGKIKKEEKKT